MRGPGRSHRVVYQSNGRSLIVQLDARIARGLARSNREVAVPPGARLAQTPGELLHRRCGLVDSVSENVQRAGYRLGGELRADDEAKIGERPRGLPAFGDAVQRVVIGNRHSRQAGLIGQANHIGRTERAVRRRRLVAGRRLARGRPDAGGQPGPAPPAVRVRP